jgi:hypothetical protein
MLAVGVAHTTEASKPQVFISLHICARITSLTMTTLIQPPPIISETSTMSIKSATTKTKTKTTPMTTTATTISSTTIATTPTDLDWQLNGSLPYWHAIQHSIDCSIYAS